jgi:hypothetical protein
MLGNVFSIFMDYKCNFSCAHCSVGSTPKTVLKAPLEQVLSQVDQIAQISSAKVVVFTGGEATLHKDMLIEGIKRAKSHKLITRLVTNAWWAKTPERAAKFFAPIVEAGLDEFNTSFDSYHEPFVTLETIANAVQVALDAKLRIAVACIKEADEIWNRHRVSEVLAQHLGMDLETFRRRVYVLDDFGTPAGSGSEIDMHDKSGGLKDDIGCPQLLRTISMHPDGTVKACCGHAIFYTPDLTIGSSKDGKLPEALDKASRNLMYMWIGMRGPTRILRDLGVDQKYNGQCHACLDLLTTHRDSAIAYLRENREKVFIQDIALDDSAKRIAQALVKANSSKKTVQPQDVVAYADK